MNNKVKKRKHRCRYTIRKTICLCHEEQAGLKWVGGSSAGEFTCTRTHPGTPIGGKVRIGMFCKCGKIRPLNNKVEG